MNAEGSEHDVKGFARLGGFIKNIPRQIAVGTIVFYRRFISPLTPPSCRFYPTCSEYALTSFKRFGFMRGLWLTVRRISKCHPFHVGGYDPVPEVYPHKRHRHVRG